MTKDEFYQQRKELFTKDFEEFRKTKNCRESTKLVAEKNNVTRGLVNRIIYSKEYPSNTRT